MHNDFSARPLFVVWNPTERRLAETVASVGLPRRARSLVPPEITPLPGFCPSQFALSACEFAWPAARSVRPAVPKAKAGRGRARGPAGAPVRAPLDPVQKLCTRALKDTAPTGWNRSGPCGTAVVLHAVRGAVRAPGATFAAFRGGARAVAQPPGALAVSTAGGRPHRCHRFDARHVRVRVAGHVHTSGAVIPSALAPGALDWFVLSHHTPCGTSPLPLQVLQPSLTL